MSLSLSIGLFPYNFTRSIMPPATRKGRKALSPVAVPSTNIVATEAALPPPTKPARYPHALLAAIANFNKENFSENPHENASSLTPAGVRDILETLTEYASWADQSRNVPLVLSHVHCRGCRAQVCSCSCSCS